MSHDNPQSLSSYLKRKLNISLKEYAILEGVPQRTLQDRWSTQKGFVSIQDAVFRRYVQRFGDL